MAVRFVMYSHGAGNCSALTFTGRRVRPASLSALRSSMLDVVRHWIEARGADIGIPLNVPSVVELPAGDQRGCLGALAPLTGAPPEWQGA